MLEFEEYRGKRDLLQRQKRPDTEAKEIYAHLLGSEGVVNVLEFISFDPVFLGHASCQMRPNTEAKET
jgi:hypothetical protein